MRKILDVTLDDATHVYSDLNNFKYDSVTTILGHYKEKFDPYKTMADGGTLVGNYVKKNGQTEQYWIDQWQKTGDIGRARGTAFHLIKENLTKDNRYINIDKFQSQDFNGLVDKNPGLDYSQLPDGVYPEITVFNRRFMIAGQIDKLIIEKPYFDIDDYKTNGKYDVVSFKPPRGKHKMMKYPVAKFMDCHLYHHTLQLSFYAWMLKQFGLIPRRLRTLHYQILEADEKKLLLGQAVEHLEPAQYLLNYEEEAVVRIIKHYTSTIRK